MNEEEIKEIEERSKITETLSLKECYEKIKETIRTYIDIDEKYVDILTCWVIGTYIHDQFNTYPYIFINATKGGGKTRLLKLLAFLSKRGKVLVDLTEAVLFREAQNCAFFIDELENITSKEKTALRLLLNCAYKKGMVVKRMQKIKRNNFETQIAEEFEVYTPVAMANIWGLDDVLQDRCITIRLEKSSKINVVGLLELWENDKELQKVKASLENYWEEQRKLGALLERWTVIFPEFWNALIKSIVAIDLSDSSDSSDAQKVYTHEGESNENILSQLSQPSLPSQLTQLSLLSTITTNTTVTDKIFNKALSCIEEEYFDNEMVQLAKKIFNAQIFGRDLELFFPIFIIANFVSQDILEKIIENTKEIIEKKKEEEKVENRDMLLIAFLYSIREKEDYMLQKDLANDFKAEIDAEWINSEWLGRALKRLNLVKERIRTNAGIQVKINWEKVKEKAWQMGIGEIEEEEGVEYETNKL